jgi:hypothetical protein
MKRKRLEEVRKKGNKVEEEGMREITESLFGIFGVQTPLNVRHTPYRPRQHDVQYSNNLHISILFNVLYGCETWSLTLREEHVCM